MGYRFKEQVEICSSEQDEPGSYYPGTVLAAVGRSQYLVQYKARQSEGGRPLVRAVDEGEIRPVPPDAGRLRVLESDVVDGYVNGAWRVGRIVKRVEPNYYVKVDSDGAVHHLGWYRVRIHLDLVDGKWVCRKVADDGLQTNENEVKPMETAPDEENGIVECPVKLEIQE
uniref:Agenet-like domain-containing protein n=1 Tax=Kalanchoe fedtschenkoi TaxID=63787 RepID=A0A7N0U2P8_KALFE